MRDDGSSQSNTEKGLPETSLVGNRNLSASQGSLRSCNDNDSSATLSADEGPHGQADSAPTQPPSRPQSEGMSSNVNSSVNLRPHSVPYTDNGHVMGVPICTNSGPASISRNECMGLPAQHSSSMPISSGNEPANLKSVTSQPFAVAVSLPQLPQQGNSKQSPTQVSMLTSRYLTGHPDSCQLDPKNDKQSRLQAASGTNAVVRELFQVKKSPGLDKPTPPACVRDLIHSAIERNLQQHHSNDAPSPEPRRKCIAFFNDVNEAVIVINNSNLFCNLKRM